MNNYDDIINLDYNKIKNKNGMSVESRAAIFSPFAALTGYDDAIEETIKYVEDKIDIDENYKKILNDRLVDINSNIKNTPLINITYFIKDDKKSGGKYLKKEIKVKKIDLINNLIITDNKEKINIDDIIDIEEK